MRGLLERFHNGDRQALARILTNVENQTDVGREAIQLLNHQAGAAHLIGLTGPPGAGKSTLANAMVKEFRRRRKKVAVLAIDPSSPFTGGAALGDRIRLLENQSDDGVYLRSMASRGHIGGLTIAAFGAAIVLDAFGFDVVLIETVGTGQDEHDIASLADTVIVVQTPGMGDSIQAFKAGILEIADVFVVNKADTPGADDVVRDLRQEVRSRANHEWSTPVLPISASRDEGIEQLIEEGEKHYSYLHESSSLTERRAQRLTHHARMLAMKTLSDYVDHNFDAGLPADDPAKLANEMIGAFVRSRA